MNARRPTIRPPVIAGNWKMHHAPAQAAAFCDAFVAAYAPRADRTIALFPPAISLAAVGAALEPRADVLLGVQNIHYEPAGAFTGEISAEMAHAAGADLVLVGHSERRHVFGERSDEAGRKVAAALRAGMLPVLCIGETLDEREAGRLEAVLAHQLEAGLAAVEDSSGAVLVAYEPVWAIGTGRTATPADASAAHAFVRNLLRQRFSPDAAARIPILYGGSVKPGNAAELLAAAEIDGLLVGGASLDAVSFARLAGA